MSRCLLIAVATSLVVCLASAEDPSNSPLPKLVPEPWEKPATSAEQYRELAAEHRTAQSNYDRVVRRARTDAENQKLTVAYAKRLKSLAVRFMELARENAGDPVSIDALVWVAMHTPSAACSDSVMGILNEHRYNGRVALIEQHLTQAESPIAAVVSRAIAARK